MSYLAMEYNDGGRSKAGYTGATGDCVCRAISIATETPYQEVYDALAGMGKKERKSKRRSHKSHPRTGVYRVTYEKFLKQLGWTFHATMGIGTGCRVHLRADELPEGRLIVRVSKHLTTVIDGVLYDTHDPTREGTRCVYGYYMKEGEVPHVSRTLSEMFLDI